MKLIVGLGNPGNDYVNTRHNLGFKIIDNYLGNVNWSLKFNALIYQTTVSVGDNLEKVIFAKPQTFMNLSGNAVGAIVKYFNISLDDVMIIHDDIDLSLGKTRLKFDSSAGGHNGIKSIISSLGSQKFLRLKIGIAKTTNIDTISYVLGKLSSNENNIIESNYDKYKNIIDDFIFYGKDKVLNNGNERDI